MRGKTMHVFTREQALRLVQLPYEKKTKIIRKNIELVAKGDLQLTPDGVKALAGLYLRDTEED